MSTGTVLVFLIIFFLIFRKNKKKDKQPDILYNTSLSQLEGKNFFCYNNKTDVQNVIETFFIPQLSSGIEIIFLNGKRPESAYDSALISGILYRFKRYSKFPHLFKVRHGKVIERSINNEFYNMLDQKKPTADFFKIIDDFFEIKTPPDTPELI